MQLKKILYICTALLAAVGLILLISALWGELDDLIESYAFTPFLWQLQSILSLALTVLSIIALIVLSIVHSKKETPKLLLATCGFVIINSYKYIVLGWMGPVLIAAGLLPVFTILLSKKFKEMPAIAPREKHYRLLMIAGILASIMLAYNLYNFISNMILSVSLAFAPVSLWTYISVSVALALIAGQTLSCFLYTKKRSGLLRMLFFGSGFWNAVLIPINICLTIDAYIPRTEWWLSLLSQITVLTATILVFVHTLKMRKTEKALTAQVQDENLLTERSS